MKSVTNFVNSSLAWSIRIYEDSVKIFLKKNLIFCLGQSRLNSISIICATAHQAFFQLFQRGRHNKNGKRTLPKIFFQPDASLHIHIKNHNLPGGPDALYFAFQGAIKFIVVHLFPFHKVLIVNFLSKFLRRQKIVIPAVLLGAAGLARGGRNGKGKRP